MNPRMDHDSAYARSVVLGCRDFLGRLQSKRSLTGTRRILSLRNNSCGRRKLRFSPRRSDIIRISRAIYCACVFVDFVKQLVITVSTGRSLGQIIDFLCKFIRKFGIDARRRKIATYVRFPQQTIVSCAELFLHEADISISAFDFFNKSVNTG